MRLTKFKRLRNAIANLDYNFVNNSVDELSRLLSGRGQIFDLENAAVTEEGIFYIAPETGMCTKVALYIWEQDLEPEDLKIREVKDEGYKREEVGDLFHEYHLLRCNTLTHKEIQGWKDSFRITQRLDGKFYYQVTSKNRRKNQQVVQDIENQRLEVCPNCLVKINSLLGRDAEYTKDSFELRTFFDAGFQATWKSRGAYSRERGMFADIYPKDWEEISSKRMSQAQYICEECNTEFSKSEAEEKLVVLHIDYLVNKISYVRLRCLCEECAEYYQPKSQRQPRTSSTIVRHQPSSWKLEEF